MRKWWLMACLVVPAQAFAQAPVPPLSDLVRGEFPWARYELRVPNKREWLARARFCEQCDTLDAAELDTWHVVDLDADGRPDLLRTAGTSTDGGEATEGRAYRNTDRGLVLKVWSEARIDGLVRRADGPGWYLVLVAEPLPCTIGTRSWLAFVRPSEPMDTVPFREDFRIHFAGLAMAGPSSGLEWPKTWLPRSVRVRIAQDLEKLRSRPVEDDTTLVEDVCSSPEDRDAHAIRGNVEAALGAGALAVALAQQQVGNRTWYFVVTEPGASFTTRYVFESGARLAGWMSVPGLETLPEAPPPAAAAPRGTASAPRARASEPGRFGVPGGLGVVAAIFAALFLLARRRRGAP